MGRRQTRGNCVYCGREMTRSGLSRHLQSCSARQQAITDANGAPGRSQALYHLQIQDAFSGDFWLHLEMRGRATLADLDSYLRAIWLECCGHLSQYKIGATRYTQIMDFDWMGSEEKSMDVCVDALFTPGLEIPYEYDFGSTTGLNIKVVSQRMGTPTTAHPIALMARNGFDPPPCIECGKPATHVCMQCAYERDDGRCELCDKHAKTHPHDEYGWPMPLVNSPRTGVCGYTGPAKPPY